MEKMSYKISSRATILIGREGVSRADGAIIELIKNTYDADAKFCYLAFDIENDSIYILDNGTGMTRSTIENAWMLIGTDNKKRNFLSENNRVRSGEKGIGRFALDRLGRRCTMYTKHQSESLIYWYNEWDKFEEDGKTLDEIQADFEYKDCSFEDIIPEYVKNNLSLLNNEINESIATHGQKIEFDLDTGTLFIITGLRDLWSDKEIKKIFSVLGFLVPPGEQTQYFIFAQKSRAEQAEVIECEIVDDFDYKVRAQFDGERVKATIYRNEYDLNIMPKDLFLTKPFKTEPYNYDTFKLGKYEICKTINEVFTNDIELSRKAKELGPFEFQYVFMKLSGGGGEFYYKPVNPNRKLWIEEHGGIKLYRDNFVVRPYGDSESKSFDWLGLDARKGINPVAISHKSENWHVNNSQIQGTVLLSRIANSVIVDKSSREGLIENDYFDVLANILIYIISLFEKDRSYIAHHIKLYNESKSQNTKTKEDATDLADKILAGWKGFNSSIVKPSQAEQLAKAVKIYQEERDEFITEIKLLRALATNGLMTTAMVHDLKTINSILATRADSILIAKNMKDEKLFERHLEDLKLNDQFLHAWISIITAQSKRDRRKRLKKDLVNTIKCAVDLINPILTRKQVILELNSFSKAIDKKIFETDFDSIIYNLIINSIESFEESQCENRRIVITLETIGGDFIIHYNDNGYGLKDKFLASPYDIFNFGTSSKVDSNGNQIGTGMGMYIVASSVNEYNGSYKLTKIKDGFGLDILIPVK